MLRGISFDVPAGTVTAVIGPSGSGKTTVLRTLNALDQADAGVITIGDVSVDFAAHPDRATLARFRAQSGMVFQSHNLFPHKTVLQNVIEGPVVVQRRPKAEARDGGAGACWRRSAWRRRRTSTRTSSPAASSSASASPARWRCGPS